MLGKKKKLETKKKNKRFSREKKTKLVNIFSEFC